jgi:hypothetical protein
MYCIYFQNLGHPVNFSTLKVHFENFSFIIWVLKKASWPSDMQSFTTLYKQPFLHIHKQPFS